MTQLDRNLSHS